MKNLLLFRYLSGGIVLLTLAGCNRYEGPPLAKVTGVVKLEGQPLPQARVLFRPLDNQEGSHSSAITDEQGRFTLRYTRSHNGAILGTHLVTITTGNPDHEDEFGNPQPIPEVLPDIYHKKSILQEQVVAKTNHFEFELEPRQPQTKTR